MTTSPVDLLRKLASGVRPDAGAVARGASSIDAAGFDDLLRRAQRGELSSNKPVRAAPGAASELDPADLDRLSVVADAAEAAGARRVVAVLDDTPVLLDVLERTVLQVGGSLRGVLTTGIDAVVVAPRAEPHELRAVLAGDRSRFEAPRAPEPRDTGPVRNPAVTDLLAALERPASPPASPPGHPPRRSP